MRHQISQKSLSLALLAGSLVLLAHVAQAAPYYYFLTDATAPEKAADQIQEQASDKAQQVASQVQEAAQGVQQQVAGADGQLPHRIHDHLSELYSHGSSAVRGVVDQVQPDIKNIGRDLSDVYQATRSEVGKRIEPIAQTMRPYIDQAQKVVAPYVNSAREEVPKLINQAGPALSKVSGQVRDGITGVWSKINGADQPAQSVKDVQDQIQAAAEKAKQHVSNTVQQQASEASQTVSAATTSI